MDALNFVYQDESQDDSMADEETRLPGVPEEPIEGYESVSDIADVELSDGAEDVTAVLIDVGGFLGMFERTVAVDISQVEIQMDPEGNDIRVYLDMTEEQLENLPEYE